MYLPRILEPEVMDDPAEAALYDAMDHQVVNRAFVDSLIAFHSPEGEILDLATGTALIPIEICRRRLPVRIVATDLSPAMLDMARVRVELAGFTDRIRLDRVDAKQLPFADGQFPWVISNSLVHHLDHPEQAFREAIRVTAPGGRLFFRDLMRPDSLQQLEFLVQLYSQNEPTEAQKLFADSLHAALRLEEIREIVATVGFRPETVQATSDRHWTWSAVRE